MFTNKETVRGIPLTDPESYVVDAMVPVIQPFSKFVAMDVDTHDDRVYFSDVRNDMIFRTFTNGTGKAFMFLTLFHFETTEAKPYHVGIHEKALTEYYQMSTNMSWFQPYCCIIASSIVSTSLMIGKI